MSWQVTACDADTTLTLKKNARNAMEADTSFMTLMTALTVMNAKGRGFTMAKTKKVKPRLMALSWDEGKFYPLHYDSVVDAIYAAWNYEDDVYDHNMDHLVFSGRESNEFNNELLEPYKLRVIDHGKIRALQNTETDEIYIAEWEKEE